MIVSHSIASIAPQSWMDWLGSRAKLDNLRRLFRKLSLATPAHRIHPDKIRQLLRRIAEAETEEERVLLSIAQIEEQYRRDKRYNRLRRCLPQERPVPHAQRNCSVAGFLWLAMLVFRDKSHRRLI